MPHAVSSTRLLLCVHLVIRTIDHLTSQKSSCPLNPEELKNHLSLIERIDRKLHVQWCRSTYLSFTQPKRQETVNIVRSS